jgi:hypothetical protein
MTLVYKPGHPQANKNGMVDKSLVYEHLIKGAAAYVISDTIDPTRHMCDGRYYDSKAKFREVTRAHGCIEVGNEAPTLLKPRKPIEMDRGQRRNDIRKAIYELRNGR